MDKQKLAESMAEFLGWVDLYNPPISHVHYFGLPKADRGVLQHALVAHFFSPNGFFAVWREAKKRWTVVISDDQSSGFTEVSIDDDINCETVPGVMLGRDDEFTALFEAVHEMRQGK